MNDLGKLLIGIASVIVVLFLILGIKNCGHQPDFVDDTTIEEESNDASNIDSNMGSEENAYELSTLESQVIAEVNRCRQNPSQYADDVLVPYLNSITNGNVSFQGRRYTTVEGEAAVIEAIKVLREQGSLCQLECSQPLYILAKEHCNTQGPTGDYGHDRTSGVSFQQRTSELGLNGCGENISYGFNEARLIVIQLLVDDGVPSRGHRENILRPEYKKIGVAAGGHKKYNYMCVLDFQM